MMPFLVFFLALSLMIFAHELGHFLVSKKSGVRVDEFGFGYPPRLFGVKIGKTIYSVNLIPMGGFVRVWGMEEKVTKDKKRAFYNQPSRIQFLILVAGVLANFLVSVGVFGTIYGIKGIPEKINKVQVLEILPNSPAEESGMEKDILVTKVITKGETSEVKSNDDFIDIVNRYLGEEITLLSDSGKEFVLTPRENPPEGEGALGVVITDTKMGMPPLIKRIPLGIWYGLKEGVYWGKNIGLELSKMILGIFRGRAPKGVAGPIGIYKTSSEILEKNGLLSVIHFFAVVSINLVIINLLPIPGTDGWHISLLVFERIRGRKVADKTKRKINQIGMTVLLALFFLILIADVKRFLLG